MPLRLRDEELESGKRNEIHEERESQARIEQEAEDTTLKFQMHEVRHHHDELDDHHDEKRWHEQRAKVDVIR